MCLVLPLAVKDDSAHTIGVEFGSKVVPLGGKTVKLQVWRARAQCASRAHASLSCLSVVCVVLDMGHGWPRTLPVILGNLPRLPEYSHLRATSYTRGFDSINGDDFRVQFGDPQLLSRSNGRTHCV